MLRSSRQPSPRCICSQFNRCCHFWILGSELSPCSKKRKRPPGSSTKDGHLHGFLLDVDGSYTTLDVPGADTEADGINDAGQIVGQYGDEFGDYHGFLLHVDGSYYTTFDVPGASLTLPYGINASGQIVGSYQGADGTYHGFIATPGG
jgi:probable HAF family extracellular repeat protein